TDRKERLNFTRRFSDTGPRLRFISSDSKSKWRNNTNRKVSNVRHLIHLERLRHCKGPIIAAAGKMLRGHKGPQPPPRPVGGNAHGLPKDRRVALKLGDV